MKKHLALLIASVAISFSLYAEPVSLSQARRIAENFLGKQSKSIKSTITPRVKGVASASNAPYYIFNSDNSFVIVSGNDALGDVIAYGDNGTFSLEGAPSNVTTWLSNYARYAEEATTSTARHIKAAGTPVVEPLLGNILWGQDAPYNDKCPTYSNQGTTTNYYVGCVATAMSQIMRYYKYPEKGTGKYSYVSNVGELSADFGNTTYLWDDMLESYAGTSTQAQRDAVATLCAHIGISVNMTYEPAGSGAFSQVVPGAMKDYFGYDKGVSYLVRDYYTSEEWMALIKKELDAKRPVYYSASNDDGQGGHAFVCDGYDSNGFVHINWGWKGKSNGYFMVNYMNPDDLGIGSGSGGYNTGQEIIIGIQPSGKPNALDFIHSLYGYTRFSASVNGGSCMAMTYIVNEDSYDFNGSIAAVLTQNGNIKAVLATQDLSLKGVNPSSKNITDMAYFTMRDIPVTADVADGNYHMSFAYKAAGNSEWTILRHSMGYPSYAEVTASNKQLNITTHVVSPDAELTKRITFDGEVYAKGSAYASFAVFNKSTEVFLNNIRLKLTSVSDPSKSYLVDSKTLNSRVYDNAEKDINILFDLTDDIVPGKYTVTAVEKGFESYDFDNTNVGATTIEVLAECNAPIIRAASAFDWIASPSNERKIAQGESLLVSFNARNYGTEGNADVTLYLKDVNSDKEYVFVGLAAQNFKKGTATNLKFFKRLDVNPGTYKVMAYATTTAGTAAVPYNYDDCTITVESNPDIALVCTDFTLPETLVKGKQVTASITIKALQDISRYVYVRLRKFENKGGEIVTMNNVKMNAGEEKTINFRYSPGVALGDYVPLVESKVSSSTFETVGNFDNYYKVYHVTDGSGIGSINTQSQLTVTNANGITTVAAGDEEIQFVEVYNIAGQYLGKHYATESKCTFALDNGFYIINATTAHGVVALKHVVE